MFALTSGAKPEGRLFSRWNYAKWVLALHKIGRSIEIGIDSFAASKPKAEDGNQIPAVDRIETLSQDVKTADRDGLDYFGIGEHHRSEFLDTAPVIILVAAAARTRDMRQR